MMDKRKLLKLVVLAFGVSILLLVFGYTNGPKIVDEHTIRYVLEQEPSTLDPAKSSTHLRRPFNYSYLMVWFV